MAQEEKNTEKNSGKKFNLKNLIWIIAVIIAGIIGVPLAVPENNAVSELEVHYIDVGQGDSIYISSGDDNMLIDCGEKSEADTVTGYLKNMGVENIDYIIGTHPHSDHMGGMSEIVKNFEVGEFIIPHLDDGDVPSTVYFTKFLDAVEEENINLTEAQLNRKIKIGSAECTIIAPNSDDYSNANNYSVVVYMSHGDNSFLFTGDAESLAEKEILQAGAFVDADVLKVGHHGSDTSSSEEFLKAVTPEYAVISCGVGNSYGHPKDVTLEKLSKYTDRIYRTDINGTVVFKSDGEDYEISEEKP